jgi:hypothetical protein
VLQLKPSALHPPPAVPHWSAVHVMSWQSELSPHDTSQAQLEPQLIPRQEFGPVHSTSHCPDPHATLRHEPWPEHSTVHAESPVQVTPLRHEFGVLQLMVQSKPAGQLTALMQLPLLPQSILQVCAPRSQVVQTDGQLGLTGLSMVGTCASTCVIVPSVVVDPSIGTSSGTMQKPFEQMRGESQSTCVVHA